MSDQGFEESSAFSTEELKKLTQIKTRYPQGDLTEIPLTAKQADRLNFVRYLTETQKLNENQVQPSLESAAVRKAEKYIHGRKSRHLQQRSKNPELRIKPKAIKEMLSESERLRYHLERRLVSDPQASRFFNEDPEDGSVFSRKIEIQGGELGLSVMVGGLTDGSVEIYYRKDKYENSHYHPSSQIINLRLEEGGEFTLDYAETNSQENSIIRKKYGLYYDHAKLDSFGLEKFFELRNLSSLALSSSSQSSQ